MSWPLQKLSEYFEITSSKRVFKSEWTNSGVPFYRAREVVKLAQHDHVDNDLFISEAMYADYKSKYGVPSEGDLLITGVGTLGKVYIVKKDERFYFKDGNIIWLKKKKEIDSRYVDYAFGTDEVQRFIQNSPGATVGTYTISKANETLIPVPPLSEQKRIATILDKADAIRRKRQQAIQLADEFLRSVFLDMFGDPVTNSKGWELRPVSYLAEVTTGNTPSRKDPRNYGDYIEWIKSDNINTPSHFLTCATEYLSELGATHARTVESGAVLLTCIAGSKDCIGNAALADRKVSFNQQINALTSKDTSTAEYLYSIALFGKKLIQSASTNSMKGMVSKGNLQVLKIPCPPKSLQQNYSSNFRKHLISRKKLELAFSNSEELFNALSQNAFAGDL